MSQSVVAYCLPWHIADSAAFHDILVNPLAPFIRVQLNAWHQADVQSHHTAPIVFCQVFPPTDTLNNHSARLVWIPMWDSVRTLSQRWWNNLPKHLRIVAFSNAVAQRAESAGLPVLRLNFFKNPAEFPEATWGQGRVLFYWNRRGIVDPNFLERLCDELKIERLLFRQYLDPDVSSKANYSLPERLGRTVVETISGSMTREEFWRCSERANIFLAPRLHEGVGMTFLEAMARGNCVIAHDAPTMNEYIVHGANGLLLRRGWSPRRVKRAIQARLARFQFVPYPEYGAQLPHKQNWANLASYELASLGRKAREEHYTGYEKWRMQIPEYARFITEW